MGEGKRWGLGLGNKLEGCWKLGFIRVFMSTLSLSMLFL